MSDPVDTSGANEGPIELTIGFRLDNSLGDVLAQAKEMFERRMKQYADMSLKDIKEGADELLAVTDKVEQVGKLIFVMDAASRSMRGAAEDANASISMMQNTVAIMRELSKEIPKVTAQMQASVDTTTRQAVATAGASSSPVDAIYKPFQPFLEGQRKQDPLIEETLRAEQRASQKAALKKPTTTQTSALSADEEVARLEEEKRKRIAASLVSPTKNIWQEQAASRTDVAEAWPIAELMMSIESVRERVVQERLQSMFAKEISRGSAARRGGTEVGEYTPIFEEMIAGEWSPSRFRGQADIALGTSQTHSFLRKGLLGAMGLSEEQIGTLTPEKFDRYYQARETIQDAMTKIGRGLQAVTGGVDPTSGDLSIDVLTEMSATQTNMQTLEEFRSAIEEYLDFIRTRNPEAYLKLFDRATEAASRRQSGDWNAEEGNIRALRDPDEYKLSRGVSSRVRNIDRTLRTRTADVESTDDVRLARPAQARYDLATSTAPGERLRSEMEAHIDRALRDVMIGRRGIPEPLMAAGFQNEDELRALLMSVVQFVSETPDREEYTGTGSQVERMTGLFGGGPHRGAVRGMLATARKLGTHVPVDQLMREATKVGEDQALREQQEQEVLAAISEGRLDELLEEKPHLRLVAQSITQTARTWAAKMKGKRPIIQGGDIVDYRLRTSVDERPQTPEEKWGMRLVRKETPESAPDKEELGTLLELVADKIIEAISASLGDLMVGTETILEYLRTQGVSDSELDIVLGEIRKNTRGR